MDEGSTKERSVRIVERRMTSSAGTVPKAREIGGAFRAVRSSRVQRDTALVTATLATRLWEKTGRKTSKTKLRSRNRPAKSDESKPRLAVTAESAEKGAKTQNSSAFAEPLPALAYSVARSSMKD